MNSIKLKKISANIAREVSAIIMNEARDGILKSITITSAEGTNDLSFAKIYFTSILDIDKKSLEKEVNEASSFIRGFLSKNIELRHTPELRFIYDESIEYGQKIDSIIKNIHEEK